MGKLEPHFRGALRPVPQPETASVADSQPSPHLPIDNEKEQTSFSSHKGRTALDRDEGAMALCLVRDFS